MKKIILVAGARPNFMKISPIYDELKKYSSKAEILLVHTGQHYDPEMSDTFFRDLELPKPDIFLGIGSASHAEQTAKIMLEFEKVVLKEKPDIVVVVGDVNSTLACSLVTSKIYFDMVDGNRQRSLIAHIEAGLRSFDRTMPEEINRIVTDSVSDFLFTTCEDANENLKKEGISENKIFFVGNVMIDTLLRHKEKAKSSDILEKMKLKNEYAVLTLHRPSNVDDRETFSQIVNALKTISEKIPIVFPAHPRTKKQIENLGLDNYFEYHKKDDIEIPPTPFSKGGLSKGIHCTEPLGYLDFLHLMSNARLVLTDSGGIQEETTILGVPCFTLRENTERPITITEGTNILVGMDKDKIVNEVITCLTRTPKKPKVPKLWDGKTAERIVNILLSSKAR